MEDKKEQLPHTFCGLRVSACVEIAIFFLVLFFVAIFAGDPINFFTTCPHPYWIIVIMISAQYGTLEGLLAALAATAFYLLGPIPPRDILQEKSLYFYNIAIAPILWFVAAVILGELRMRHIRERDRLRDAAWKAEAREKQIADAYSSLKKIKERLEMRVASEIPTALMLIDSFKELEGKNQKEIIDGIHGLTKALVAPEKSSIYFLEGNELILKNSDGWEEKDEFSKQFSESSPLYQSIVNERRIVFIHTGNDEKTLGKEGVLAVPVIDTDSNRVLGMIKVEMMPFLRLKMAAVESLRVIGEWAGRACARILPK